MSQRRELTILLCLQIGANIAYAQCALSAPAGGCPNPVPITDSSGGNPQLPMNVNAHIDIQMNGMFIAADGVVGSIGDELTIYTNTPGSMQSFSCCSVLNEAAPKTNDPDQLAKDNGSNYLNPTILFTSDISPACMAELQAAACTVTAVDTQNRPIASVISLFNITNPNTGIPYDFNAEDMRIVAAVELSHAILALGDCDPVIHPNCGNSSADMQFSANHATSPTYCDLVATMAATHNVYGVDQSDPTCPCNTPDDCGGGLVCLPGNMCGCSDSCDDPSCTGYSCDSCGTDCFGACSNDDGCGGGFVCIGGVCGCGNACDDQSCSGYNCDSCGTNCGGGCSSDDDCGGGLVCMGGTCGCGNICDDPVCDPNYDNDCGGGDGGGGGGGGGGGDGGSCSWDGCYLWC